MLVRKEKHFFIFQWNHKPLLIPSPAFSSFFCPDLGRQKIILEVLTPDFVSEVLWIVEVCCIYDLTW